MGLDKPTQELRLDLNHPKWSAVDLMQLAVRLSETVLETFSSEKAFFHCLIRGSSVFSTSNDV